jgi:Carboxypeptidase regulatory-like domain
MKSRQVAGLIWVPCATVCALLGLIFTLTPALAQSTFSTILGTVTDDSGAVVPGATVKATNTDENTSHTVTASGNGDYEFVNTKPGHYKVEVSATGFQAFIATGLLLIARQMLRVDVRLQISQLSTATNVEATAGVIATDTPTIQSSLDSQALLSLPANIRAGGSTSPYALIAVLPGVQPDDYGGYSIQGGIPSMSQFSLDGISITTVNANNPMSEAFPSLESIAEIKVQGAGNSAEFGEVGDVTTISKSGTNEFHGDLFWYHQNRALDATAYGQQTKPQKIGNDFGASAGGPLLLPGLYNGKNKTFFFGTFEGFRFPQAYSIQNEVPTQAMRNGDFSQSGIIVNDPLTGQPFPHDKIPASRISSVAQGFLTLYPLPNAGDLNQVHAANYIDNRNSSLYTNQYDARIDHYFTSKMSVFGRWTWKSIGQDIPQDLLVPSETYTDKYKLFVVSWNWTIRPNLINEFRFGLTLNSSTQTLPFDGPKFTNALGLVGVGPTFPFNGLPFVNINGYQALDTGRDNLVSQSNTGQWADNTTWSVGHHTMKFGFDIRRLRGVGPLTFTGGDNYGYYNFTGAFSNDSFADFLLGLPHDTAIDNLRNGSDGRSVHHGVFAQDVFRVSPRLTLEYGLRWEYHPGYTEQQGNIGNFDPSVPRSGAVIYPTGKQNLLAPLYLASFDACPAPPANGAPCTPVLSARQAHLPEVLRTAPTRVVPRFGFAFRPSSNGKTVLRGAFGVYDTPSLGLIYGALVATLQADIHNYYNIAANGGPVFQWPQIRTPGNGVIPAFGTTGFFEADQIHWKEPYTMQWNFSIDRDIGFNTGLRISYIGMGTRDLVWLRDMNQSHYSTQYYASQPLSSRPFPNWGSVGLHSVGADANYQSAQIELSHRFQHGLTFNSTYTFAKSLADNQGSARGTWFAAEGFNTAMDSYNRRAGYGEVSATRRHRWITTAVYELPLGRGRAFLSHANRLVDGLLGGWGLSHIFLIQSGPYETPYFGTGDPSGTGSGNFATQRPDRIKSGSLQHPNANQWIDPTAFVCPGVPGWTGGQPCTIGVNPGSDPPPIGRFGNSGIGVVTGPGTINLSTGLGKTFAVTEGMKLKIEGSFTNILNHVNLSDPQLAIDAPSFGQITSARASDFGGYRTGQVSIRLEF